MGSRGTGFPSPRNSGRWIRLGVGGVWDLPTDCLHRVLGFRKPANVFGEAPAAARSDPGAEVGPDSGPDGETLTGVG